LSGKRSAWMTPAGRVGRPVGVRENRARPISRPSAPPRPRRPAPRTCPRAAASRRPKARSCRVMLKSLPREVHPRQRLADLPAVMGGGLPQPHAFEEGNQCRRPAGEFAEQAAVPCGRPAAGRTGRRRRDAASVRGKRAGRRGRRASRRASGYRAPCRYGAAVPPTVIVVHAQMRLADADRHALARPCRTLPMPVSSLDVVADHRDAVHRVRAVADQHRALDRPATLPSSIM
jgi:hypothetical protein